MAAYREDDFLTSAPDWEWRDLTNAVSEEGVRPAGYLPMKTFRSISIALAIPAFASLVACDSNEGNKPGSEPRKEEPKPATPGSVPAQGPPDGRSGGSTGPTGGGIGNPKQLPKGEPRH